MSSVLATEGRLASLRAAVEDEARRLDVLSQSLAAAEASLGASVAGVASKATTAASAAAAAVEAARRAETAAAGASGNVSAAVAAADAASAKADAASAKADAASAKADAASAKAGGVEAGLSAHESANNPHGITPEKIGALKPADVVPAGTGTEVIATIGGKEIKAPAGGGGGGGKCILTFMPLDYDNSQYVEWNDGTKTCKITCGASGSEPYASVYIDGTEVGSVKALERRSFSTVCKGRLSIGYDGHRSDCMVWVDGELQDPPPASIDSTGHTHIFVEMASCLEADTPITMADGTVKRVCDLRVGDLVLALDPYTMTLVPDEVVDCDGGQVKTHGVTDVWTFDDGTVLKTVHPHEFFNVRTGRMEYISKFKLGDRVRKSDGTTTALANHEKVFGEVRHNTLFTRRFNNYFASGILTGNRASVKWGWSWRESNGGE